MLEIAVHDLDQARAALETAEEAGVPVSLRSAPDAAFYAGVGYLKALCDEVGHELVIDCGDDAGLVMAALREGCQRLAFSGSEEIAQKLADMAGQLGAELRHETAPPDALVLSPEGDARAAVLAWLRSGRPAER
jgi:fructose/tagatose bisphosphate aldolase